MTTPESHEHPVEKAISLRGETALAANRELTMMALALGARCTSASRVVNAVPHPELDAFVRNLQRIGLGVGVEPGGCVVTPAELSAAGEPLNCGASRVHFACLAGLLAAAPFAQTVTSTVDPKLLQPILKVLDSLDVRVAGAATADGTFTVTLGGRRPKPGTVHLEAVDEAVKTALFLAAIPVEGTVECFQPGSGEDTVEPLFKAAGIPIDKARVSDEEGYRLSITGPLVPHGAEHELPGDPDAALYVLFTAAYMRRSEVVVANVGTDWKSRRVLDVLRWMNAQVGIERARTASRFPIRRVTVKGSDLRSTRIAGDLSSLFLNELPFLAMVGACAAGEAIFRDAAALRRQNGSDAIALTVGVLREMGVKVGEMPDGLVVQGGHVLQGSRLDAGGDARVAVGILLAGMTAEGTTVVVNAGPVDAGFGPVLEIVSNLAERRRVDA